MPQTPHPSLYPFRRLHARCDGGNVINRVYVTGGYMDELGTTTDTFTGDGTTKNFTLTNAPVYAVTSLTVAGSTPAYGLDKQYGVLLFRTAPANGAAISVTYQYAGQLHYMRDVTDRGGSEPADWCSHRIVNTSIKTLEEAQRVVDSVLIEYASPTVIGSFVTNKLGLEPGMQMAITDSVLGLSGNYTIRRVSYELDPGGTGVIATVQFGARPIKLTHLLTSGGAGSGHVSASTYGSYAPANPPIVPQAWKRDMHLRLNDLEDVFVDDAAVEDGEALVYDAAGTRNGITGVWVNGPGGSGSGAHALYWEMYGALTTGMFGGPANVFGVPLNLTRAIVNSDTTVLLTICGIDLTVAGLADIEVSGSLADGAEAGVTVTSVGADGTYVHVTLLATEATT